MMARWRLGGVRHLRTRTVLIGVLLFATSVGMLVAARSLHGFYSDLLLNLGSSMVLAAVSYVIFDPLFEEARKARVQEHDRFDQTAFIDRIRETRRNIRILDTWTILLQGKARARTLHAMREALEQGATIRVLLLDPGSAAAQQRTDELERRQIDVAAQIMENLRHLHAFREGLDSAEQRSLLKVCVYDASPSIQLYQWDGRALISFFPIGKVSFDVPQLEVDMASPWGQFVDRRFDELWDHRDYIRTLDRYWRLTVTLTHGGTPLEAVPVPYISAEDVIYIDGTGPLANQFAARMLPGPGEQPHTEASFGALAVWPPRRSGQQSREFDLIRLDEDQVPGTTAEVLAQFEKKYGGYPPDRAGATLLLRLVPR
ncbi:hypothetical protein SAMN05421541_108140 [Actinoplanes philippinensis]|uniref:Uncharacterized protein n=1 Tax=Actinoplanes philippinensis TaxID=35752 RepID=A0A1I2HGG4_9ACTN|nr:hypothetical protein [Actinoplanes philippinensis]SFF28493.1 hypothetical protein SAMN05421541_108140 [Actinoplanes philippinensis]